MDARAGDQRRDDVVIVVVLDAQELLRVAERDRLDGGGGKKDRGHGLSSRHSGRAKARAGIHSHDPRGSASIDRRVVMDSGLAPSARPGMTIVDFAQPNRLMRRMGRALICLLMSCWPAAAM